MWIPTHILQELRRTIPRLQLHNIEVQNAAPDMSHHRKHVKDLETGGL